MLFMKTYSDHWNKIFSETESKNFGWYENDFGQTQKYLDLVPDWKKSKIFIPGVGNSGLIDILLNSDTNIVLNDVSSVAIEQAKIKYGNNKKIIQWICQDISDRLSLEFHSIDIWIDRAVLHFLIAEEKVEQYFKNLLNILKIDGYVLFAEFSKNGATTCSGLKVRRYDINEFQRYLPSFELIDSEEFIYRNPSGNDRPYIYTLFKRNG